MSTAAVVASVRAMRDTLAAMVEAARAAKANVPDPERDAPEPEPRVQVDMGPIPVEIFTGQPAVGVSPGVGWGSAKRGPTQAAPRIDLGAVIRGTRSIRAYIRERSAANVLRALGELAYDRAYITALAKRLNLSPDRVQAVLIAIVNAALEELGMEP